MRLSDLIPQLTPKQRAALNPLRQRNIYDAKRYAARIGWCKPQSGKAYPYRSIKRGGPGMSKALTNPPHEKVI